MTSSLRVDNGSNKLILYGDSSKTELHAAGSDGIIFKDAGNSEKARLTTGGCLGINEDSVDAYLHLSNSTVINQKFERPGAAAWRLGIPASQTYFAFDNANDSLCDPKVIIDTNGRLGIGTTSPVSALHVAGEAYISNDTSIMGNLSVHGDMTYINTSITTTSALSVVNAGTGPALFVRQEGAQPVAHFVDAEGDDVIIDNCGKVGIGTYSPSAKLDVYAAPNTNTLFLRDSSDGEYTHNFYVDSSGNGHTTMYAEGNNAKIAFSTAGS
jgi:hypothetical protein